MAIEKRIGAPVKFETPEQMQAAIDAYFESCWEHDDDGNRTKRLKPYTVTGLALSIGMTREGLVHYSKKENFTDTIKNAKQRVQNFVEDYLFTGSRTAGAIFNLKNNFGWVDKQVVENEGEIKVTIQRFTPDSASEDKKDE